MRWRAIPVISLRIRHSSSILSSTTDRGEPWPLLQQTSLVSFMWDWPHSIQVHFYFAVPSIPGSARRSLPYSLALYRHIDWGALVSPLLSPRPSHSSLCDYFRFIKIHLFLHLISINFPLSQIGLHVRQIICLSNILALLQLVTDRFHVF